MNTSLFETDNYTQKNIILFKQIQITSVVFKPIQSLKV